MAEEPAKTAAVDPKDVEKNKTMAILAYFIFFLPLLTDAKDSKFAKFHANQALLVLIMYILSGVLTFVLVGFLLYIVAFVFWVLGIVAASQGQMKRLPLIGGIDIIK